MSESPEQTLTFTSEAVEPATLLVTGVRGRESISQLFRFEIDLMSRSADLDLGEVLIAPAQLGIKQARSLAEGGLGVTTRFFDGVLESFEVTGQKDEWTSYRAVLRPRIWELTRTTRTRLFLGTDDDESQQTVVDLVRDVLTGHGLEDGTDFEFRIAEPHPGHEYVVQYEESDWDFLCRWLEHEGVFYFFENDGAGREKIVFADSTAAYQDVDDDPAFPFRPEGASATRSEFSAAGGTDEGMFQEEFVSSLGIRQLHVPRSVEVNDYNWRTPDEVLHSTLDVADTGVGLQLEYNDHFKTPTRGSELCGIRKDEHVVRQKTFHGVGTARSFRPGFKFTVDGHYRDDCGQELLLTGVVHEAEQKLGIAGDLSATASSTYTNSFEAALTTVTFRPARSTPWPSIKGLMHAIVDGATDGEYAEIDELGRYKVRLPMDVSGAGDGRASRFVRKAQPYTGQGYGMHFPLHKGCEVLLAHVDGDPDRPVIVGAVPNANTPTPVIADNNTQCRLQSGGRNMLEFEDAAGAEAITLSTPTANTVVRMGAPTPHDSVANAAGAGSGGSDGPSTDGWKRKFRYQEHVARARGDAVPARAEATPDAAELPRAGRGRGTPARVEVVEPTAAPEAAAPEAAAAGALAAPAGEALPAAPEATPVLPGHGRGETLRADTPRHEDIAGWVLDTADSAVFRISNELINEIEGNSFAYTEGDSHSVTKGDTYKFTEGDTHSYTIGDSNSTTEGNSDSKTVGNSTSLVLGNSASTFIGTTESVKAANDASVTVGMSESFKLAGSLSATIGGDLGLQASVAAVATVGAYASAKLAAEANATYGARASITGGTEVSKNTSRVRVSDTETNKANILYTISVGASKIAVNPANAVISCGGTKVVVGSNGATVFGKTNLIGDLTVQGKVNILGNVNIVGNVTGV